MPDHDPLGVTQAEEEAEARRIAEEAQRKKAEEAEEELARLKRAADDEAAAADAAAAATEGGAAKNTPKQSSSDGPLSKLRDRLIGGQGGASDTGESTSGKRKKKVERGSQQTPEAIGLAALPRWEADFSTSAAASSSSSSSSSSESQESAISSESTSSEPRFAIDSTLNRKLILSTCDPLALVVDALVHSSNEPLSDRKDMNARLFAAAGRAFAKEVKALDGCRTGESKITLGGQLHARHVIHTVGPRYNERYRTAAENALHNCYRSCLQLLCENDLHTIAFPTVNTKRRGYPPVDGAHIAIRTVRRFLEHFGNKVDTIVFCVSPEDLLVYQDLLPLYFPRTDAEVQRAVLSLPEDVGNEWGETIIAERQIRISAFPGSHSDSDHSDIESDEEDDESSDVSSPAAAATAGSSRPTHGRSLPTVAPSGLLTTMQDHPDEGLQTRTSSSRSRTKSSSTSNVETLYEQYLNRAHRTDLSDIAKRRIVYRSGTTTLGRPIIVVAGCRLPASSSYDEYERVLLYMIKTLDPVVEKEYVLVYLHGGMSDAQRPEMDWLKRAYDIWDAKYSENLQAFLVVHPTFWLKLFWNVLRPLLSSQFYQKLRYFDSLRKLYGIIDPSQLSLPQAVIDFDQVENGSTSFQHISNDDL